MESGGNLDTNMGQSRAPVGSWSDWIPASLEGSIAPGKSYTPIDDDRPTGAVPGRNANSWRWSFVAGGFMLFSMAFWAAGPARDGTTAHTSPMSLATSRGDRAAPAIGVKVYNEYTRGHPIQLYPWEHMAEPHRPTTLKINNAPEVLGEDVEYRWVVVCNT